MLRRQVRAGKVWGNTASACIATSPQPPADFDFLGYILSSHGSCKRFGCLKYLFKANVLESIRKFKNLLSFACCRRTF